MHQFLNAEDIQNFDDVTNHLRGRALKRGERGVQDGVVTHKGPPMVGNRDGRHTAFTASSTGANTFLVAPVAHAACPAEGPKAEEDPRHRARLQWLEEFQRHTVGSLYKQSRYKHNFDSSNRALSPP
ncbi:MAG: K(+)/H(+) antiporter [Watsoniomyces obsoletus]|nr:MAG: K(+)/H(+) antiporter [Watsoniomyces obsoletus]